MTERSTAAQVTQIGLEAVAGTAVPATRRLGSMSITPAISAEADVFRPEGMKFGTTQVLNREWTTADVGGKPTYEEVVIPLCGAVDSPTVSEVLDGATPTGAYEWVFEPDSAQADNPKTFSLERGQDGASVEKMAHLLFTSFGLEISRTEVNLTGSAFAKAMAQTLNGLTPALSIPTDLNPITPGSVCIYMADTHAGLIGAGGDSEATARRVRVVSANPSIEDRYNPAWFVNCTEDSFTTFVENPDGVGGGLSLTEEADNANGMALLAKYRAGDTVFVRIEAQGPVIYNAGVQPDLRNLFQWDMALKMESPDAFSDEDGIYAIPWTLRPVHDATWGKAMSIMVRNKVPLASL